MKTLPNKKQKVGQSLFYRVWSENEGGFFYFEEEGSALSYLQDLREEKENVPYQRVEKHYMTSQEFNSLLEI